MFLSASLSYKASKAALNMCEAQCFMALKPALTTFCLSSLPCGLAYTLFAALACATHSQTCIAHRLHANLVAAVTLSWALDVTPDDGFLSVAIHPGSVSTDMTTAAFG